MNRVFDTIGEKMNKTKIVLVGYGSQGTRIAEAISAQPDFQLIGICLKEPDVFAHMASRKGYSIYVTNNEDIGKFKESKIDVKGTLPEVLPRTEVVVDATPRGVGKKNKEKFYSKYDVKSVFQAGEAFDVADIQAFMSIVNYNDARRSNSVRIPLPLTASLMRTLKPLDEKFHVKSVTCTFIRPGSEPMKGYSGPVDTIVLDRPSILQSILQNEMQKLFPKNVLFTSMSIPSILLAIAVVVVDLKRKVSAEQVIGLLSSIPRTILVKNSMKLHSTDAIFEYIRRAVRPSADIYELCIWYEHVEVTEHRLKIVQAFDPHSIQIPEVIDAIRALTSREEMQESFEQTNKALNILCPGIYP